MTRRRRYRAVSVKKADLSSVEKLAEGGLTVGLDIAKEEVFVVVRDAAGGFLRPWKAKQPTELRFFVDQCRQLAAKRPVVFGLESTGTYGDALRQAMSDARLEVHRVSGKAKSDYEEVFDGVPSAHDGKDAAIIAELVALGKSQPWLHEEKSQLETRLRVSADWLDTQQDIYQTWLGRIESRLARHWPEATTILKLTSVTLHRVLVHYGGPSKLAQDTHATQRLRAWGGSFLSEKKIEAFCQSAQATVGVRMAEEEQAQLQRFAEQAFQARCQIKETKQQLCEMAGSHETLSRMGDVVGSATACVLYVTLGDPHQYHCAEAYRKALGLNLKEHSSGKHKGKLKISKRGSSQARRWLYFAALRMIQESGVRQWYEAKKQKDQGQGSRGVIAVMRKLALAIWHVVVRGVTFDPHRLFPGRPLPSAG